MRQLRQKTEVLQQLGHFRYELIDGLHQQGPVALRQGLEVVFGEGAAAQLPGLLAVLNDQARFDFVFQRQAGQFVRGDRVLEVAESLGGSVGVSFASSRAGTRVP